MDPSPIAGWTTDEAQALTAAMSQSFGPCECMQHVKVPGSHRVMWQSVCPGHAFLAEQGQTMDRAVHMLHLRRDRQRFIDAEWRDDNAPPAIVEPAPAPAQGPYSPVEPVPEAPAVLPW